MKVRLLQLLLLPAVLAACVGPSAAPPRAAAPLLATTPMGLVSVRVPREVFAKRAGFGLQNKAYSAIASQLAFIRLEAIGVGMSPTGVTVPLDQEGAPIGAVTLQVPQGRNRVFLLSGLNLAGQPVITLKAMASVSSATSAVNIDLGTTPAAEVLQRLIGTAPTVASGLELTELQNFLNQVTLYNPATRSFEHPPGQVDTVQLTQDIIANAGGIPAVPSLYRISTPAGLTVLPVNQADEPIVGDVRLMLSDPTSTPVTTTSSGGTISTTARGRWVLSASHPTLGVASVEVDVPHTEGAVTIKLQPHPTMLGGAATQVLVQGGGALGVDALATSPGSFDSPRAGLLGSYGLATTATAAYLAEHRRIRRIDLTTGAITTLVGDPSEGGVVDGPASTARFDWIGGLTADPTGTYLYATDGNRIRRVTVATGEVSTLAGADAAGAINDSNPLNARFQGPRGLTVRDGKLYVADTVNREIRRIDLTTGVVDTLWDIADREPLALAVGSSDVYVAMGYVPSGVKKNSLWRYPLAGGTAEWLAGDGEGFADGLGASARFDWWSGYLWSEYGSSAVSLTLPPAEDVLYVSDPYNHRIRRVDLGTTPYVGTLVGSAAGGLKEGQDPQLLLPGGTAWVGGQLLVFDAGNARLRSIDPLSRVTARVAGAAGQHRGPFRHLSLSALALDPVRRKAYTLDPLLNRVLVLDLESGELAVAAGSGIRGDSGTDLRLMPDTGAWKDESLLVFDVKRNKLYLTEEDPATRWRIRVLDLNSSPVTATVLATDLPEPDLALARGGDVLFAADRYIDLVTSTATPYLGSGAPTWRLLGATATHLYAGYRDRVVRFAHDNYTTELPFAGTDTGGVFDGTTDGLPGTGTLYKPRALVADPQGQHLYMTDASPDGWLRRIRVADGMIETVWTGTVEDGVSIGDVRNAAVDADGTLVLERGGGTLMRLNPSLYNTK